MSKRFNMLQDWLQTNLGIKAPQLVAITNDASFRRYFRVIANDVSYIVMDAPPDKENCAPFIDVAKRLQSSGLNVPQIVASHLEQGFLLLTDLGSQLYLSALNEEAQVESLYSDALQALMVMQVRTDSSTLPLYNHHLLHQEMNLFTDWLIGKHLDLSLEASEREGLEKCFELLSAAALSQPQVFVHRDYHSRNLMVVSQNNPGILDFQDAVKGPVTYDLVSLLRDCYIAWPRERVDEWGKHYYKQAQHILNEVSEAQFLRWFDWMGIQRHLKASGIFARLYHRDGKSGYLKDIPRTLNYIVEVSADYPELATLHKLVNERVLPKAKALTSN
ncbi:phosphotransferase [Candidatus Parabeggiatoa sp. HSG14]|uniref:aminoglycoside phosphotransferase family protein n=1 Tax=Candidatus Parabeggiatoa sp. HSG14 TaxID=3055593 RepID=UPI0025A7CB73|nr:phosphotransferase [Thiotrichales bacterium HSG14]